MSDGFYTAIKHHWEAMPKWDRMALAALAGFLLTLLLVFAAMLPAQRYADAAAAYFRQQSELFQWVEANAARVQSTPLQSEATVAGADQSLLAIASATAKQQQISFKRFEPNGDAELRIWLEKVPFNTLLVWLEQLDNRYSVTVAQANIDRRELAGSVNARVVLVR